jgi:hypothetical protein
VRIHLRSLSLFLTSVVLLTPPAMAQQASGIAGIVRDSSGAVLPGVTVEAASPALIEKVRTAVTDGEGRFSIVDLRPGDYAVTFTLPGFSTVRREGINLPGGFTATINAEMRVGGLEETITVTGESPIVDVQAVRQQTAVTDELLAELPTATRTWGTLATLTPGLNYASGLTSFTGTGGVYAENNPQRSSFGIITTFHGKTGAQTEYDGMGTNYPASTGGMGYVSNAYTAEEMRVQTGGISAESKTSGMTFDMIPKEGANIFSGLLYGHQTSGALQSSNLSDSLRARGLTTGPQVDFSYDVAASVGGPVMRDKLWFFTTHRRTASKNQIPGLFYNGTQSTPFYTPDQSRPAFTDDYFRSNALRLTWQASARNKVNVFADNQRNCACRTFQPNQAIEAMQQFDFRPQGLYQVTWSSPHTNRLLFEAGSAAVISRWHSKPQPEALATDIPITEQRTGLLYNARAATIQTSPKYVQRFSASYVTGSHAFKVGFLMEEGYSRGRTGANSDLAYQFLDGAPVQIQQNATPRPNNQILKADLGVYAQDRWTINRLTLNVGLRFDYFNAYVPAQSAPAGQWVPERHFDPIHDVPNWKSLNPRVGGAYDLFGNGRTAVKASIGRYNGPTGVSALKIATAANPMVASVNSVNRTWTDSNRNYVPDCDLANPLANGECGQFSNLNFGKVNITTRYADDVTRGWKARDYLWDVSTEVQHQLLQGLSVTGGYYRNWYGNFSVTDNVEVGPADFSPFCVSAPRDNRLSGGGGYQVCGLYDVSLAKFGRVNNVITQASQFGEQTRVNDFFTGSFSLRVRNIQAGGGVDTGRTVTDQCFTVDSPQQQLYCHQVIPFRGQTQIKMYATYPLPFPGDIVVSGAWQNASGPSIEANYPAVNAEIAPSLGRNLAACGTRVPCTATASIPLIEPFTQFEGRRNQLDLRLSKSVGLPGGTRLQGNVDIFNVFNNAAITIRNNVFGSQWGRPQAIVEARLIQIGGQLTF